MNLADIWKPTDFKARVEKLAEEMGAKLRSRQIQAVMLATAERLSDLQVELTTVKAQMAVMLRHIESIKPTATD